MNQTREIFKENEQQANIMSAKVMRITCIIFTFIYILDIIGIFIVELKLMTAAYVASVICLLLPTFLINVLKRKDEWIKYIIVICAIVFIVITTTTLTHHAVLVYVYAIAIANLYFSRKLNIIAMVFSVIGVSIGQILAFRLQTLPDENLESWGSVITFGVLPRALVLIAIAAIFTMICKRTDAMLGNLMGAAEQQEMLTQMRKMKEKSLEVSGVLLSLVTELAEISDISSEANQKIAKESEIVLNGSSDNTEYVKNVNEKLSVIIDRLIHLNDMSMQIKGLSEEVKTVTEENQKRMNQATDSMEQIHQSTGELEAIIARLGEQSNEIIGIVNVISVISSKTNILALNASIEAARAGEHGRGFATVAKEIQNLSEQTKGAVGNIATIIREVVENTEKAVDAMQENARLTESGRENIRGAKDSSSTITEYNNNMTEQIHNMDEIAKEVTKSGKVISQKMDRVSKNTENNFNAMGHVTEASKENSESTGNLVTMVERIRELAEQLNKVVNNE